MNQLLEFRRQLGESEGKRPDHKDAWVDTPEGQKMWNSKAARRGEIPSAGGLASASALGAVANMLAQRGKSGGVTVIGEKGWEEMHKSDTEGNTFGMRTFYTQVKYSKKISRQMKYSGWSKLL